MRVVGRPEERRIVALPSPVAPSNVAVLPNNVRSMIVSLTAIVTTSATAGNRAFVFRIIDQSGVVKMQTQPSGLIAASQTYRFTMAVNVASAALAFSSSSGSATSPIPPDTVIEVGDVVMFYDSNNISTSDTISSIVAIVDVVSD